MTMNAKEKIELITSGLQEVLKGNILEDVIEKEGRSLKIYWGMFNSSFDIKFHGIDIYRLS